MFSFGHNILVSTLCVGLHLNSTNMEVILSLIVNFSCNGFILQKVHLKFKQESKQRKSNFFFFTFNYYSCFCYFIASSIQSLWFFTMEKETLDFIVSYKCRCWNLSSPCDETVFSSLYHLHENSPVASSITASQSWNWMQHETWVTD